MNQRMPNATAKFGREFPNEFLHHHHRSSIMGGNAMDVRACILEDDVTKPPDLSKRKHLF